MHDVTNASGPRLVFSLARLRENASTFRAICERTLTSRGYEAYFPVKVAPLMTIVACVQEQGFGLEAISPRTAEMAQSLPSARTILGGPAKTEQLIAQGLPDFRWTYVSCESLTDLAQVNRVVARHGSQIDVLLRLKATVKRRLGMSPEDARWSLAHAGDFPALRIVGLHLHSGSNVTDREADLALERMRVVAEDLQRHGMFVQVLNFGGGFPCVRGNEAEIQRRMAGFDRLANLLGAGVIVEPGRALIGDAAQLLTEVIDVRPAERELTINSAAYVIHGPCNADKFILHQGSGETAHRRYRVVKRKEANYRIGGIWPAEGDSLWLHVPSPDFAIGDHIVFPQAGAYTLGFLTELAFDELAPIIAN